MKKSLFLNIRIGLTVRVFVLLALMSMAAFSNKWWPAYSQCLGQGIDTIVVLAGNYEERIPAAALLFKQHDSARIVLTNDGVRRGWSPEHQRNLYAIERSEIVLLQAGVPAACIDKLPYSASGTVYDARAVRSYLQSHPAQSLLLVTSDYHARRTLWIFRRALKGMPVAIAVTPVSSGWSSVVPIMLEPVKMMYYWVRFGLLGEE